MCVIASHSKLRLLTIMTAAAVFGPTGPGHAVQIIFSAAGPKSRVDPIHGGRF